MAFDDKKGSGQASNTPYDDAFRTLLNDCSPLVIPLVNEMFDKDYKGDERIVFHPDTHFINQEGGNEEKRITDSFFSIVSDTEERYLLECQSTADNSMLVRLFEYATQAALDSGTIEDSCLRVRIPAAAVLFLRSTRTTPTKMRVEISTPGGDVAFGIPVLRIKDYTLEVIFERGLFFLVPFYIFTRESEFDSIEADANAMDKLTAEYAHIMELLEDAALNNIISFYQMRTIIEMSKVVLDQIARKHKGVREKVGAIMGGVVLEHESKTILNEGISIGREEGIDLGIDLGRTEREEEMLRRGLEEGVDAGLLARIADIDTAIVERMREAMTNEPKA